MEQRIRAIVLSVLAGTSWAACAADANPLAGERWRTRPLVLVVPAAEDPMLLGLQAELRRERARAGFQEREMVLFTVIAGQGRREGQGLSAGQTRSLLDAVGAAPDGPAAAFLIGKDGGVKLAERGSLSLDAVFALIDGMPMRRR